MVAVSSVPAETLGIPVLAVEMVAVKVSVPSKAVSSLIVTFTVAVVLPAGNVTLYGPAW